MEKQLNTILISLAIIIGAVIIAQAIKVAGEMITDAIFMLLSQ